MEYKQLSAKSEIVDVEGRIVRAIVSTSDVDDGLDIIMPGAFSKSLSTDSIRKRVKMLWQHKHDYPIGKPTLMEELPQGGLMTESYVSRIQKGTDYLTLASEGIITEFSIGFTTDESSYDKDIRKISDLTLFEYSPVTWGMNSNTQLLGIKSIDRIDAREIERVLREAGLSRSQAKAIACAGVKSLREVGDEEKALAALHEAVNKFSTTIKGN